MCVCVYIITVHMQFAPLLARCCVLLNAIFVHRRHEKIFCPFVFNFCIAQTRISVYMNNASVYAVCECYCHAAICYFMQFYPATFQGIVLAGLIATVYLRTPSIIDILHTVLLTECFFHLIYCALQKLAFSRRVCPERLPKYIVYISQLTSISRRDLFYIFIITESNIRNVKYRIGVRYEAMVCMSCHILLHI